MLLQRGRHLEVQCTARLLNAEKVKRTRVGEVLYLASEAELSDAPLGHSALVEAPGLVTGDARVAQTYGKHFEGFLGANNFLNAGDKYTGLRPLTVYVGLTSHY